MATVEFRDPNAATPDFNKWDIPVKMGVLIGLLSILLSVINYMFLLPKNYIAFMVMSGVMFLAMIILYWFTGARQRKAMGGFITLKEAFSTIFVAILISSIISTIWGILYAKIIDPHVADKVKAGTLEFMQNMHAPQDKLDETAANLDKQFGESMKPSILLYSYAKGLVMLSIFGFICAFIVKRKPKEQML